MGNSRLYMHRTLREITEIPPYVSVTDFGSVCFASLRRQYDAKQCKVTLYFTVDLMREDYIAVINRAISAQSRCVQRKSRATVSEIRLLVDLTNEKFVNHEPICVLAVIQLLEHVEMAAKQIIELQSSTDDCVSTPVGRADDKEWRYQLRGLPYLAH